MIKVTRLERKVFQRLAQKNGYWGKVGWVYEKGFYVLDCDDRPIYFYEGMPFHIPFSIIVDCSLENWINKNLLLKNDLFFKQDSQIFRFPKNDCIIGLFPQEIVDLDRTVYKSPPRSEIIVKWIKFLTEEILHKGKFEGMAGSIVLLKDRFSELVPFDDIEASVCSRHAIPDLLLLLRSSVCGGLEQFLGAWKRIVGLGLGLTPSGDDVLVGFLASHKILSSNFWKQLNGSSLNNTLVQIAVSKTTPVASEFLRYALDGIFSDTLYHVFEALPTKSSHKTDTLSIQEFINWGHTSGTDTLVGVVLGLSTILQETFPRLA